MHLGSLCWRDHGSESIILAPEVLSELWEANKRMDAGFSEVLWLVSEDGVDAVGVVEVKLVERGDVSRTHEWKVLIKVI